MSEGHGTDAHVQRLDEGIQLLREDLRISVERITSEIREGLANRPTHSDLGGLKLYLETRIDALETRTQAQELRDDKDQAFRRNMVIGLMTTGLGSATALIIALIT